MKKVRPVIAPNARELANVLGLAPADEMEIEFRADLNGKIIEVVAKKGLTHSDVAQLANTSRTRVTAITEPQHPRHFVGSHAPCLGLARGPSETPIQERRLRFTNY
jgi:hypothetical protein